MAKRSRLTRNPGQWNFFGGGLDRHERPEKTARRELREEAGLIVRSSQLIPLGEAMAAGKNNLLFGLSVDSELIPRLNHESESWRWMQPDEVAGHHLLHHATRQLWPVCAQWLAGQAALPLPAAAIPPTAWQRLRHIFDPLLGEPN